MAPIAVPMLNGASESVNFSGFVAPVRIIVLFLMLLSFLAVWIIVSVPCVIIILLLLVFWQVWCILFLSCCVMSKLSFLRRGIIS